VTPLREPAPGKVNVCLFLGGTRADGRHQLVPVFESVSLADELVVQTLDEGPDQVVCEAVTGPNLVADALRGLRARGWEGPPLRIEIAKRIPVAAGMGGGSADAAAALRAAHSISPIAAGALMELAAELGADVPGQLEPGVALGTGAGERVQARAPLAAHALAVVPLDVALSTADVYAAADRLALGRDPDELAQRLGELDRALVPGARPARSLLVNDLEEAAVSLCPQVAHALDALRAAGAEEAMVCGSGPTTIGFYWGDDAAALAAGAVETLAARFPRATPVVPVPSPTSGTIRGSR
jgi:4-diphosphocytidyl-2-C-methyl-D-erythritol kinase